MKKIVIVFALSVLALVSAFAVDIAVRVQVETNAVQISTVKPDEAKFFTTNDYDDFEVEFRLSNPMFGAKAQLNVDKNMKNISFSEINAWGKFGDFLKLQAGDFKDRAGNRLTSVIDEYKLGILQYYTLDYNNRIFKALRDVNNVEIEGNRLENFVVSLELKPLLNIPVKLQFMMKPTELKKEIDLGGRVYGSLLDIVNINVTARYQDGDTSYRATIGTFLEFPNLIADLKILVGYTANIWETKEIVVAEDGGSASTSENSGFDQGIDIRAQIPIGKIILATQNNLSLYGDAGNGKKYMTVSNEVKGRMPLTETLSVSLALQSHYYNNPGKVTATTPKTFYDFSTDVEFSYTFGDKARLETGLKVMAIGNDETDLTLAIPFTFEYWF